MKIRCLIFDDNGKMFLEGAVDEKYVDGFKGNEYLEAYEFARSMSGHREVFVEVDDENLKQALEIPIVSGEII